MGDVDMAFETIVSINKHIFAFEASLDHQSITFHLKNTT